MACIALLVVALLAVVRWLIYAEFIQHASALSVLDRVFSQVEVGLSPVWTAASFGLALTAVSFATVLNQKRKPVLSDERLVYLRDATVYLRRCDKLFN